MADGRRLERGWWQPLTLWRRLLLLPLSWLYGALAALHRALARPAERLPVPVIVIGNLIAGGAGKTPAVLATVELLRRAGWVPGIVSRGYGRQGDEPVLVRADSTPQAVMPYVEAGHELAHHGWTHRLPASLSREEEEEEIVRGNDATPLIDAVGFLLLDDADGRAAPQPDAS